MKQKLLKTKFWFFSEPMPTFLRIMKKSVMLCLLFIGFSVYSFSQKISIEMNGVTISEALNEVKKKSKVDFFYSDNELNVNKIVNVNFNNSDILEIVSHIVGNRFTVEKVKNNVVLISPDEAPNVQDQITVTGNIRDANGVPLAGASVVVKGSRQGAVADFDGNYKVLTPSNATLVFSYLGYITQELAVNKKTKINVLLKEDVGTLDEVVITGIVERKRESYTGAITTISSEELKEIGNQNVIESIKTLDPSFIVLDNNEFGSNPNVLPDIEVRGKTSLTTNTLNDEFGSDPNRPLFVLDGFETSLRTIVDLDMNRVKSITILKDAASTALYGSKAANGVVVVETKTPVGGQLRLSYTGDFRFEGADLSDYNLMNAAEKLEFERLSGRWTSQFNDPQFQVPFDSLYNEKLKDVERGIDTYWLKKPLTTGFTQGHSIYVDGGDKNLLFGAGLNFRQVDGVMKGASRQTWGGDIKVTYRKDKLNISNRLYVSGADANESEYGAFSKFANANPYYLPTDENGEITRYLDLVNISGVRNISLVNPLYSSTLNNRNNTVDFNVENRLSAIYKFNPAFRLQGGFLLRKNTSTAEVFTSPEETQYDNVNFLEKGQYSQRKVDQFTYNANLMLVYSKVFEDVHAVTANFRTDIEESTQKRYGTSAVGFPVGSNGNPNFAFGYEPDSKPSYVSNTYRRNNILTSMNYAYDKKYLLDVTYRFDGSTAFGSNQLYNLFYSSGIGWNLHNEFNFNEKYVNFLKLRLSTGVSGNQNFGSVVTTSVYQFSNATNIFGQGVNLTALANEDLEWQNTVQTNLGLDSKLFDNRLTASFELYRKKTDPLVVILDLPSSTGLNGYPLNTGYLTVDGAEAIIRYSPIYNLDKQIVWTLGATIGTYKSTFGGFNKILENLNDDQLNNNSLIRYRDGFSPDDIWAVESLGIDPGTGKEVFLKENGQTTFDYDFNDEKVVGNSRPKVEGVLSSRFKYKDFTLSLNLRYRYGGDAFNRALYSKVENISRDAVANNQDARALNDRWQQPGDIAQFKAISLTTSTPISSRFVQKENTISGESMSLGYRSTNEKLLSTLGIKGLRFTAYMNDIFRISTIQVERGITYPFSRSVSFSVNASF